MQNEINIPIEDLSKIFDEIKTLKNEIEEARIRYYSAVNILSNEYNYAGGVKAFLEIGNSAMFQNLDKLSQYYQSCYIYILDLMNMFIGIDEEITRKLYVEFQELKRI